MQECHQKLELKKYVKITTQACAYCTEYYIKHLRAFTLTLLFRFVLSVSLVTLTDTYSHSGRSSPCHC